MKKEYLDRWLAALRSGKYKQTSGALKRKVGRGHAYCCMGVLCEVMKKELPFKTCVNRSNASRGEGVRLLDYHTLDMVETLSFPPDRLYEFVGGLPLHPIKLAQLNDRAALSFKELADLLEEAAEGEKLWPEK